MQMTELILVATLEPVMVHDFWRLYELLGVVYYVDITLRNHLLLEFLARQWRYLLNSYESKF